MFEQWIPTSNIVLNVCTNVPKVQVFQKLNPKTEHVCERGVWKWLEGYAEHADESPVPHFRTKALISPNAGRGGC